MFFWWLAGVILAADGKIMQENRKRIKSFCNLRERGPLVTLPQLCQNYMLLCVRIGKLTRSATSKTS